MKLTMEEINGKMYQAVKDEGEGCDACESCAFFYETDDDTYCLETKLKCEGYHYKDGIGIHYVEIDESQLEIK